MTEYQPISRFAAHRRIGKYRVIGDRGISMIEQKFKWLNGKWEAIHCDGRFADAALDDVVQPDDVLAAVSDNIGAMVVHGPVGIGKTFLAYAIVREHVFLDIDTLIVSEVQIEKAGVDDLVACRALIIDDFGVKNDTPTHDETLFRVIDGRYDRCQGTVITTNLNAEQFIDRVGDRINDRLAGPRIVLAGPSRRQDPHTIVEDGNEDLEPHYDAVKRIRTHIGDDADLYREWASAIFVEGLFEVLNPTEYPLFPTCSQYEVFNRIARHCFGSEAEQLLELPGYEPERKESHAEDAADLEIF